MLATCCESCDELRERIRQLEEILGQDRCTLLQLLALGLSGVQARTFSIILARRFVTKDQIYTAVYGGRDVHDWTPQPKVVDVNICKLRRSLRPLQIYIETVYGEGIRIDAENAARARALMQTVEISV